MTEPFGSVLRRFRLAAGLTQEGLAEQARVSATGVAALEAGRSRRPRLTTVSLLADALALTGPDRAALLAAATPDGDRIGPSAGEPGRSGLPRSAAPDRAVLSSSVPDGTVLGPVGGWRYPFVGRAQALGRLVTARQLGRRLVVVSGEAGIGKTRLADEFAQGARRSGALVLWGRWTEERLGPYAGFVGPIKQAVALVNRSPAEDFGQLVRLVPGLWGTPADRSPENHPDSGVETRLLFEAVSELVRGLGSTLLLLDDLHWADSASLALLEHLTTDPSLDHLMVMATARSSAIDPATAGALAELGRRTQVEQVVLGVLDHQEIARLVGSVSGSEPPEGLVERVSTACEGNAFFAEELAEHLLSSSGADLGGRGDVGSVAAGRQVGDAAVPLPARIRDVLNRRIDGLATESRLLLRTGAVLGREFDPWLAGKLTDLAGPALIAATEDGLLSGLVEEATNGRVAFSHVLVQAAADAQLSSVRRVDLHRRAARALEETDPEDAAAVADVARHWAAVAAVDRSAVAAAATWALRAGDAAMAAAATDEAIARYEQASTLWSASTAEHADALIRLGTALESRGRTADADERFRAALHLAEGLADANLTARAALGLSRTLAFGQVEPERIGSLERAIDGLDPSDDVLRPAATVMLLRQLTFDRTPEGTARKEGLRAEVLRFMDRDDVPPDLLMIVGSVRDSIPLMDPEALAGLVARMLGTAGERRDLSVLANAWWTGAWSALERADRAGWDRCLAGYEGVAERLGLAFELSSAASMRSCQAQFEGRLDDARVLADRALLHARSIGEPTAEVIHLARSVLIGLDDGQAGDLLPLMVSLADDYANVSTFVAGLCLTAALAGDTERAAHLLADHAELGFGDIPWDVEWLAVMAFYCHTCVTIQHRSTAEALYRRLSRTTSTAVRVGALTGWWGPVDHHLGALCRMLGRFDEATTRLRRAIAVEEAMGALPFLERSRRELAEVPGS